MSQIFWIVIFLTKFRSSSDRSRKKEKRFRFSFSVLYSCKSVIDVLVRKETAHLVDHANRFLFVHSARYCCAKHYFVSAVFVKFCEQCNLCDFCLDVVVYFKLATATALVTVSLRNQLGSCSVLFCANVGYSQLSGASAIDTLCHFCYLFLLLGKCSSLFCTYIIPQEKRFVNSFLKKNLHKLKKFFWVYCTNMTEVSGLKASVKKLTIYSQKFYNLFIIKKDGLL